MKKYCKRFLFSALGLSLFSLMLGCRPQAHQPAQVQVWTTTPDQTKLLAADTATVSTAPQPGVALLSVDTTQRYQMIEGFGASMTGASAYVLNRHLSDTQRQALLQELFDPQQGIGISYVRLTIGASDFSTSPYTYNDLPAGQQDPTLEHFSLDREREDLIPVMQSVLTIAPSLTVMASPWSAPAWMKTSGKLEGGHLKPEAYPALARYFTKYIQGMAAEHISVKAITIQNEPQYEAFYPSMAMTAQEQGEFIKHHLGPEFARNLIKTQVVLFDHNWDDPGYGISILNDSVTRRYVAGTAFHCYKGDVNAMAQVHEAHPDKGLYFTECSGGGWAPVFADNLKWYTQTLLMGTVKNWSRNVLMWNLALDEHHGPTTNPPDSTKPGNRGCMNCRGFVTVDSKTGAVTREVEYYAFGQFSKFVRPGAHRIASSHTGEAELDHVAFVNPDGTPVLVVFNAGTTARAFQVKTKQGYIDYTLPAGAVVTLTL